MSEGPVEIYDGMDDLHDIHTVVSASCPSCGGACAIDPAAVVLEGTGIGWVSSPTVVALQDAVLAQLAFDMDEFDGKRTLSSTTDRHLSPWVAAQACGSCGAALWAVVSWGETQPARWRLVFEGLVHALPDH